MDLGVLLQLYWVFGACSCTISSILYPIPLPALLPSIPLSWSLQFFAPVLGRETPTLPFEVSGASEVALRNDLRDPLSLMCRKVCLYFCCCSHLSALAQHRVCNILTLGHGIVIYEVHTQPSCHQVTKENTESHFFSCLR